MSAIREPSPAPTASIIEELTFREAINRALHDVAVADDRVVFLGEDIGAYGGFKGQDGGLLDRFGPRRVRDCPMNEASQAGVAIGLAQAGFRPVLEIMFAEFLTEIAEQLANWAAVAHYLTDGRVQVPLTVRTAPGIASRSSHTQFFEGWFAQVPGMRVVAPATVADAYGLLVEAIADPNPVLVYEHATLLESEHRAPLPSTGSILPIGRAAVLRPGSDVTVVAHALMLHRALEAADHLAEQGIHVEVVDLRTLSPLPYDDVLASVRRTGRLVVVQEDWLPYGVGAEILAGIWERGPSLLSAPPRRIAPPWMPIPTKAALATHIVPDVDRIVDEVRELVRTS